MGYSPGVRIVLGILHNFERQGTPPTWDAIQAHGNWSQLGKGAPSLPLVLDQLVNDGLLTRAGTAYRLTLQGFLQVKRFMSEGFNAMLVAAEQSAASRKFCKKVYGRDLCQFNMMSQAQLDKLLEVMDLGTDDHVLDLGCGVGRVSEHISDVTGARVLGIDFAAGVIQRAQARTQEKRERLSYQVMDMDELSFPAESFSGVISIDALHFASNLKNTLQSVKACLREHGQIGIFHSTSLPPGAAASGLGAGETAVARVLQECGWDYQTWNFSRDEAGLWEKILQAAEELRPEYEAEGNLEIYLNSTAEARSMSEAARDGRLSRYLYHIH